jgi:hypothetical protein
MTWPKTKSKKDQNQTQANGEEKQAAEKQSQKA